MKAYKCHRCGNLFEMRCNPSVQVTRYIHGYGEDRLDLCRECSRELIEWCNFKNKNQLIEELKICYEEPTD